MESLLIKGKGWLTGGGLRPREYIWDFFQIKIYNMNYFKYTNTYILLSLISISIIRSDRQTYFWCISGFALSFLVLCQETWNTLNPSKEIYDVFFKTFLDLTSNSVFFGFSSDPFSLYQIYMKVCPVISMNNENIIPYPLTQCGKSFCRIGIQ